MNTTTLTGLIPNVNDGWDYLGETLRDNLEGAIIDVVNAGAINLQFHYMLTYDNGSPPSLPDNATHKISDLIKMLLVELAKGDRPIVYHDQEKSAVFKNPAHLIRSRDNDLLFGGFHINGDHFADL